MSTLMHYIWKSRMLAGQKLHTTNGEPVRIIEPGEHTPADGNIFRNARLRIGEREWSGNIILHQRSSDWEKEIHKSGNDSYKNIILHIIESDDIETMLPHGEYVPQLRISYPPEAEREYRAIKKERKRLPCHDTIATMPKIHLHSRLSRLLVERIEEKARRIEALHTLCDQRWEETLFKLLARNFGFGVQSSTFEQWASLLNMQALGKHRDNPLQIEAMFFGQAGLLNEETIPAYYRAEALATPYYNDLLREYKFLSTKFGLKSMNGKAWSSSSTPHLRIARLATLYSKASATLSSLSSCDTLKEIEERLQAIPQGYWRNHLQFGGTTTTGCGPLRKSQIETLIINTIAPILYAYGKHRNDATLCEKAEEILHNLPGEINSITRRWTQAAITIDCAADSQALIQLQKNYCDKSACDKCPFAFAYIKERIQSA
ncbi:MAG: DUF2851 family protein [Bacteroidaceae bacterium]|nr:DUF2851 family protein [Bacteroidaceae bacterium]